MPPLSGLWVRLAVLAGSRLRPVGPRRGKTPRLPEVAACLPETQDPRILEAYRDAAAEMAAGGYSLQEARRHVYEALQGMGYTAAPEDRGTMRDFLHIPRMSSTLGTLSGLAHGWAQRKAGLLDIANPGQELYRATVSTHPQDWANRWAEAAAAVNWEGVARGGQMVALKTSLPVPALRF